MRALLAENPEGGPLTGFLPPIGKEEVGRKLKLRVALASTFAASLAPSRQHVLEADQSGLFEEINVRSATKSPK